MPPIKLHSLRRVAPVLSTGCWGNGDNTLKVKKNKSGKCLQTKNTCGGGGDMEKHWDSPVVFIDWFTSLSCYCYCTLCST